MSRRLIILPSALDDLKEIYTYIAENADIDVADIYVNRIEAAMTNLVDFPFRGSPQGHLMSGLRSISFERRIRIFYLPREDSIEVVRVIHMSRDLGRIFEEHSD